MLALAEYRRLLCGCGCGYLAEVSQDAAHEFDWRVEPVRCHARTAITQAAERRRDQPTPEGVMYRAYLPED